jgi:hypothetical protein
MPRDTRRRFEAEISRLTPTVRAAFLQAVADIKRTSDLKRLTAAVEGRDVQSVLSLLNLGPEYFAPLDEAVRGVYVAGGAYTMSSLPATNPATRSALVIRFQGRNPRAESWVADRSSRLIVEIIDGQRALVRDVLTQKLAAGVNPRTTALDLVGRVVDGKRQGGIVGLTSRDARAVENYRAALIEDGRAAAQIERMTNRYSNKLLLRRGETIARTETIAALNAGRDEGVTQLIERGEVPAEDVTGEWSASADGRVRDSHAGMDGQTQPHGEPFQSPTGAQMMFPGDSSLGAGGEDVINCRCYLAVKIDWLAGAARDINR